MTSELMCTLNAIFAERKAEVKGAKLKTCFSDSNQVSVLQSSIQKKTADCSATICCLRACLTPLTPQHHEIGHGGRRFRAGVQEVCFAISLFLPQVMLPLQIGFRLIFQWGTVFP